MTIEEIQEECRKRYVVGTVYKSASLFNDVEYIVEKDHHLMFEIMGGKRINAGLNKGYFYYDGNFAEILSHPDNYVPESNNLILAL